jgi:ADP-ribosylglycohydrolase
VRKALAKDILFGIAIGDALGVPVEFQSRNSLKANPVIGMREFGTYYQPKGTWSDDSSLTFCLAESLVNGYDLKEIAHKFVQWKNEAYWTPHGKVFDIGITTSMAISKLDSFLKNDEYDKLHSLKSNDDDQANGNGSLMRILPLLFLTFGKSIHDQFNLIWEVSSLTHYHVRSAIACLIYLRFAENYLKTESKSQAYRLTQKDIQLFFSESNLAIDEVILFNRIIEATIFECNEADISSSGYVLHSLEASLWCIMNYNSFDEAVLAAVNLGGDTDTTASITGGLAGIIYGIDSIPSEWCDSLVRKNDILELSERLDQKYQLIH